MPDLPGTSLTFLNELRRVYEAAEEELLRTIARRLEQGIDQEGWLSRKLREVRLQQQAVEQRIAQVVRQRPDIAAAVDGAYRNGGNGAARELRGILDRPVRAEFGLTHTRAVERLAQAATQALDRAQFQIVRTAMDGYRHIIVEASSRAATGSLTRRQATQVALNQFADVGISAFRDAAGRRWDIASYAEMATRSTLGQAQVQGTVDRFVENDYDLVIVSVSPEPCPLCDPLEGRVYSLSGSHPQYPPFQEALSDGLMHVNCTHRVGAWLPGLSREMEAEKNPNQAERYQQRQQQRHNERMIRQWKKREAVALDPGEAARARAKVRAWQTEQRRFIKETGRIRISAREQITSAR